MVWRTVWSPYLGKDPRCGGQSGLIILVKTQVWRTVWSPYLGNDPRCGGQSGLLILVKTQGVEDSLVSLSW